MTSHRIKRIIHARIPQSFAAPCVLSALLTLLIFHASPGFAQLPRPADEITKLTDDVYLHRHQSHQNIFIVTPEGVIVTDPISSDAATWRKSEITKLTDQPVRYVIYSHHPVFRLLRMPIRQTQL
jgi:hypothetical protein